MISNTDYNTFNSKVAGVTSGTGVSVSTTGNIATVNLATAGTVGTYAKVTTDAYGRVTAGTTLVSSDITSSLGFTPLNKAGDTMSGALTLPANGLVAGTNQFVLANGNVGIGTTSPGSILHLNGANPSITLQPTAGGPQSGIQFVTPTNTSGMSIGRDRNSTGTNDMFFYDQVAGATRMYISSTGNVGIGTTSATNLLTVAGKIQSTSGGIVFPDGTTQTSAAINAGTNNTMLSGWPDAIACTYSGQTQFATNIGQNGTNVRYIQGSTWLEYTSAGAYSSSSGWGPFDCVTSAYSISTLVSMGRTFNFAKGPAAQWLQNGTSGYYNAGNVGIGTTSPQSALDVSGSIVLSDGNAFATNKYYSGGWKYKANGWGGHMQYFSTGGLGLFVNAQNSSGAGVAVTDIQALSVSANGNVGIGTTNPASLLQLGTQTGASTATPTVLSLGGTYSSTAGTNMKLRLFDDSNASNQYGLGVSNAQLDSMVPVGGKFAWFVGGAEKVKIDTNGNVGIGTTTPAQALDVGTGNIKMGFTPISYLSATNVAAQNWWTGIALCSGNGYLIQLTCWAQVSPYVVCPSSITSSGQANFFNCTSTNAQMNCTGVCANMR